VNSLVLHSSLYRMLKQVALEEERALNSRHKNQVDILQLDIDQLHQQLAAYEHIYLLLIFFYWKYSLRWVISVDILKMFTFKRNINICSIEIKCDGKHFNSSTAGHLNISRKFVPYCGCCNTKSSNAAYSL